MNLTVDHNLVHGYRDYEGEVRGTDYVEGDPVFVKPSVADFHLHAISPAIDRGSPADAPKEDLLGFSRPLDGDGDGTAEYDIGADKVPPYHVYLPTALKSS